MTGIIDCLKSGNNTCRAGRVLMDSHERFEYLHRNLMGEGRYDKPCRWIIEGEDYGYHVCQYDLRLSQAEVNGTTMWRNPSEIETAARQILNMQMIIIDCGITSKGAYNVWLQDKNNNGLVVNLLIVKDYIEKIQFINQNSDSQTIYKSSVDKICFMELNEKRAIYQVAYQMMASASPTRTVSATDDSSIDELIRSTCYIPMLGNIVWNQIEMIGPREAFSVISHLDQCSKAAIILILLNVAREDNTRLRIDILLQLCSAVQCDMPLPYRIKSIK